MQGKIFQQTRNIVREGSGEVKGGVDGAAPAEGAFADATCVQAAVAGTSRKAAAAPAAGVAVVVDQGQATAAQVAAAVPEKVLLGEAARQVSYLQSWPSIGLLGFENNFFSNCVGYLK